MATSRGTTDCSPTLRGSCEVRPRRATSTVSWKYSSGSTVPRLVTCRTFRWRGMVICSGCG